MLALLIIMLCFTTKIVKLEEQACEDVGCISTLFTTLLFESQSIPRIVNKQLNDKNKQKYMSHEVQVYETDPIIKKWQESTIGINLNPYVSVSKPNPTKSNVQHLHIHHHYLKLKNAENLHVSQIMHHHNEKHANIPLNSGYTNILAMEGEYSSTGERVLNKFVKSKITSDTLVVKKEIFEKSDKKSTSMVEDYNKTKYLHSIDKSNKNYFSAYDVPLN